jgi:hypothetical protein
MRDIAHERSEDEVLGIEITDEALEAAACAERLGAYTEFAWCTQFTCPG